MSNNVIKGFKRLLFFVFIFIVIPIILNSIMVETQENEYRVIRQFGKVVKIKDKAGLSFKVPFIQTESSIPKTLLIYDLPVSDVITMDKKTMVADSFVLWKIEDPLTFIKTLNGQIKNAEARIDTTVYNSMKSIISSASQIDIISDREGVLASKIQENIGDTFSQYGIKLIDIQIKHLDLPHDNKEAVYGRMISERNNIAASYTAEGESAAKKIRTETDMNISIKLSEAKAEAEKIKAEGESEYMKILSSAYSDESKAEFYEFIRSLDAARNSLVGKNNENTLILSGDSPIAQIFNNIN